MLLAEAQPLAVVVLVVEAMVPIFVQKDAFFDRVGDPPGLVDIALEIMLWSQRIADWLQLVCEALVELRKNTSIFFNNGAELALLIIITSLVTVRNIENHRNFSNYRYFLNEYGFSSKLAACWFLILVHFYFLSAQFKKSI